MCNVFLNVVLQEDGDVLRSRVGAIDERTRIGVLPWRYHPGREMKAGRPSSAIGPCLLQHRFVLVLFSCASWFHRGIIEKNVMKTKLHCIFFTVIDQDFMHED